MKLKILLFPIAIVMAVWASIWVINPAIRDIQNKKSLLEARNIELRSVQDKQRTINSLIASLETNSNKVKTVNDFLPITREEEEIINKFYQRSVDSKVTLENLSVSDSRTKDKTGKFIEALVDIEEAGPVVVNFINVNATVMGSYENIRTFLNYIHTMEKLNSLNSVQINKGSDEVKAGSDLVVSIDANFDFFSPIKVEKNANLSVFSQQDFDFSVVEKVEKLMAEKVSDVTTGEVGKKNPFTP